VSTADIACSTKTAVWPAAAAVGVGHADSSNGVPYSNNGNAQAVPGLITLSAHNSASTKTFFAGAVVSGGFNDHFTITAPGQSGAGQWLVTMNLDGTLNAGGTGGYTTLELMAYRDHKPMQPYGSAANLNAYNLFLFQQPTHNGEVGSSWDYQGVEWAVLDNGPGGPPALNAMTVKQKVTFVVPFTFGQAFDLGIYAQGTVGQNASSGGFPPPASADLDFSHGIGWVGAGQVLVGGAPVASFSLSASSGIDYDQPLAAAAVPEPTSAALTLGGLALIALRLQRRRA
jgi:hypothetical protein